MKKEDRRSEKQVRDWCISQARKLGVLHQRMHFGHGVSKGWPDDLFVFKGGLHWWVEFKGDGGEATPLQQHMHEQMRATGCIVTVVNDRGQFKAMLLSFIEEAEKTCSRTSL